MRKLTIEFVRKEFEKEGYKLLNKEYINAHSKLDYICSEGHKHSITWAAWKQGRRCSYCAGLVKLTIEFVKFEFEKENCILLSNEYKNAQQKLDYICPEGYRHSISWGNWQQGQRCFCSIKRNKLIAIQKEFEKESYVLLTKEYKNNYTKLYCICPNGHKHSISWNSWQQGKRCPTCFFIKNSGENNPNWKGGISCEPYCFEWSSKEFKDFIKERDGNKCLNPGCFRNVHKLCVHHIDYDKKNCELGNLITLCNPCNSRANKNRGWHISWYKAILNKRYGYEI